MPHRVPARTLRLVGITERRRDASAQVSGVQVDEQAGRGDALL